MTINFVLVYNNYYNHIQVLGCFWPNIYNLFDYNVDLREHTLVTVFIRVQSAQGVVRFATIKVSVGVEEGPSIHVNDTLSQLASAMTYVKSPPAVSRATTAL